MGKCECVERAPFRWLLQAQPTDPIAEKALAIENEFVLIIDKKYANKVNGMVRCFFVLLPVVTCWRITFLLEGIPPNEATTHHP